MPTTAKPKPTAKPTTTIEPRACELLSEGLSALRLALAQHRESIADADDAPTRHASLGLVYAAVAALDDAANELAYRAPVDAYRVGIEIDGVGRAVAALAILHPSTDD